MENKGGSHGRGLSGSRAPRPEGAWEKEGLVCLENYKDAD